MVPLEQNYRQLLEKLIRLRDQSAAVRDSMKQKLERPDLRFGQQLALRAKIKVLGRQVADLDYLLARNRREIAAFGLQPPGTPHSVLRDTGGGA
jgi:hypothetical protein